DGHIVLYCRAGLCFGADREEECRRCLGGVGRRHVRSGANQEPDGGHDNHEPAVASDGCLDESQAYQAWAEIIGRIIGSREIAVGPEPAGRIIVSIQGRHDCPVIVICHLVPAYSLVIRLGIRRRTGRDSSGTRPVVWSDGSGLTTRVPAISRPSLAALVATRASCSAVTAPAETASTVAVARIVSATCGLSPSANAATTTTAAPSRRAGLSLSPSLT